MEQPLSLTRNTAGLPTGRLGVWWLIASEVVIFGGLIVSYLMFRVAHQEWADQSAHTNTWAGAFNTLVLLTSSLSAVLAHQAAQAGNGKKAARFLRFTVLGGSVFLVVKAIEWTTEINAGLTISSGMFWSFYYTATGLHGLHVLAGMVVMLFVAADAAKNKNLHRVENAGIYWHFVDLVWIFLFPLLYIAK